MFDIWVLPSLLDIACIVQMLAISRMAEQWTLTFFSQRDNRISYMNASISAQHKNEPTMKAMRVNGKITEVKQPQD